MSLFPSRNDRGYQQLPPGGLPPRSSSGQNAGTGLFDRRSDRAPPPPGYSRGSPSQYDQRGMDRGPPPQSGGSGFLSRLSGRGQERQQGGVFNVVKAPSQEVTFLNLLTVSSHD